MRKLSGEQLLQEVKVVQNTSDLAALRFRIHAAISAELPAEDMQQAKKQRDMLKDTDLHANKYGVMAYEWEILKTGDVQLLNGHWLCAKGTQKLELHRRQDLPNDAFRKHSKLVRAEPTIV